MPGKSLTLFVPEHPKKIKNIHLLIIIMIITIIIIIIIIIII